MTYTLATHLLTASRARSGANFTSWAIACTALLYCPVVTILFRLEQIDQPTSGLLAGMFASGLALVSFPQLWSRRSLGIGFNGDAVGFGWFAFACATALSCILAHFDVRADDAPAMWRQYAMAFLPMLLFYVFRELSRREVSRASLVLAFDLLTGFVIATVAVDALGFHSIESYGSRRFGILGDSVAWLLAAFVIAALARRRWILLAACVACLAGTGSRGAISVAFAGSAIFLLLQSGRTFGAFYIRVLTVVAIVLGVALAPYIWPEVVERFAATNFFENDRLDTTKFTWEVFEKSPIFGSGYNAQTYFFAQYFGSGEEGLTVYAVAVSTIGQSLADSGLVGFAMLAATLGTLMHVAFQVASRRATFDRRTADSFSSYAAGLSCWLLAFVPLNQSAGYILPNSLVGAFLFCAAGLVVGSSKSAIVHRTTVAHP